MITTHTLVIDLNRRLQLKFGKLHVMCVFTVSSIWTKHNGMYVLTVFEHAPLPCFYKQHLLLLTKVLLQKMLIHVWSSTCIYVHVCLFVYILNIVKANDDKLESLIIKNWNVKKTYFYSKHSLSSGHNVCPHGSNECSTCLYRQMGQPSCLSSPPSTIISHDIRYAKLCYSHDLYDKY